MKIKLSNSNSFITFESIELIDVGQYFLINADDMESLYLPHLKTDGGFFLNDNLKLEVLYVPKLEQTGLWFLFQNTGLKLFEFPKLKKLGNGSLHFHPNRKEVYSIIERNNIYRRVENGICY